MLGSFSNNSGVYQFLSFAIFILIVILIVVYGKLFYKSTKYGYPSTMKRTFAFLYDIILINFLVIISGVLILLFKGDLAEVFNNYTDRLNESNDSAYYTGTGTLKSDFFLLQCFNVVVYSIYSLILELFKKVSFGKRFMGIKYRYEFVWQPIVRNLSRAIIFGLIPFYTPPGYWSYPIWFFLLLSMVFPKRRWIHDLLSKSTLTSEKV